MEVFLFFAFIIFGLAASFCAGAIYGRAAEARGIALALRIESYGRQEFVDVIAKVRATAAAELTRLKKYL